MNMFGYAMLHSFLKETSKNWRMLWKSDANSMDFLLTLGFLFADSVRNISFTGCHRFKTFFILLSDEPLQCTMGTYMLQVGFSCQVALEKLSRISSIKHLHLNAF